MTHNPTPEPTAIATSDDLRYLAGYFDGEGSVCWNVVSRRAPVVYVSIQSADKEILEEFVKFFGGKLRPVHRHWHNRELFHWQRTGLSAQNTLRQLSPYLRAKQVIALAALDADFSRQNYRVPPEELKKRARIVEFTQAFNRRSIRNAS